MTLKIFFLAASISKDYIYNSHHNFIKSQWHHGVPLEENYKQTFPEKLYGNNQILHKKVLYRMSNLTNMDISLSISGIGTERTLLMKILSYID